MSSNEPHAANDAVDLEFEFAQAPSKVWRALSEPELAAQWLAPGLVDVEVGRHFELETKDGRVACEILASEPERLLRYRWRTDADGGALDTVVTFFLNETANGGTHLRLVHSGFAIARAQTPTARIVAFAAPRKKSTIVCGGALAWAA